MSKPDMTVGGRHSTARELKEIGLKLSSIAMQLRRPMALAMDDRLASAVAEIHKASLALYDLGVAVELGRLAIVCEAVGASLEEGGRYPLLEAAPIREPVVSIEPTADPEAVLINEMVDAMKSGTLDPVWRVSPIPDHVRWVVYKPDPRREGQSWERQERGWWSGPSGTTRAASGLMEEWHSKGLVTWDETEPTTAIEPELDAKLMRIVEGKLPANATAMDVAAAKIDEFMEHFAEVPPVPGEIEPDLEAMLAAESEADELEVEASVAAPIAAEPVSRRIGTPAPTSEWSGTEDALYDAIVRPSCALARWIKRREAGCTDADLASAVAMELGSRHSEPAHEHVPAWTARGGPDPALFVGPWKSGKKADLKGELLVAAARKVMCIPYPPTEAAKPKRVRPSRAKGGKAVRP